MSSKGFSSMSKAARDDLGDSATNRKGKNVREAGRLPEKELPVSAFVEIGVSVVRQPDESTARSFSGSI